MANFKVVKFWCLVSKEVYVFKLFIDYEDGESAWKFGKKIEAKSLL